MEPEEIDKLFKDRLAGLPAVPSPDAWQRLQQKMEPPKKERSLWIYYAAASVLILLISGILLIRNGNQNQNPGLANNIPSETKLPAAPDKNPLLIEENKKETRIAEQAVPGQKDIGNNSPELADKAEQIAQENLAITTPKETTGKTQKKLTKSDKNKSSYLAAKEQLKNNSNSSSAYNTTNNRSLTNTEPNAFTLADNTRPGSESALTATIVEVKVVKDYTDESGSDISNLRENLARKTHLLKNIYKQARNLKNGEPVELTALGVDKEKLEAESTEIKQKINKVISL